MELTGSATKQNRSFYHDSKEEACLIYLIKDRDEKALELLYSKYNKLIFSVVVSIVQRKEEAEDVLQELFLKIWEKAHTYSEGKGSVYSWIMTMSRNKAIDRLRSSRYKAAQLENINYETLYEHLEGDTKNPLEQRILGERAEQVRKALLYIPKKQSEVIMGAYFHEMSHSEISTSLNMPLGTVKCRIREGKLRLKNILHSSVN